MKKFLFLTTILISIVSCTTDSINSENSGTNLTSVETKISENSNIQEKDFTVVSTTNKLVKSTVNENTTITVYSSTRGFYQQISVKNSNVTKNSSGIVSLLNTQLTIAKWDLVKSKFSQLTLTKVSSYPAPSNVRINDSVASETLTISHNGKTYVSQTYDAGNPPLQLKSLVSYVKSL